jgi:hypothetical protein
MRLRLLAAVVAVVAVGSVPDALAGGSFDRVVGVGARGAWVQIALEPTGSRSDAVLYGHAVSLPSGGYVRVYSFVGGLPGIPGRFYPATRVLCLYWHEPASNCMRLGGAGRRLLAPLAALPLRSEPPTTPIAVRYRSRLLRYADGNIFAAIELALERRAVVRASRPRNAVGLSVTWRGPRAATRPRRLYLTPIGVYLPGRLFPLRRGPWCYLTENLGPAPGLLVEASTRACG